MGGEKYMTNTLRIKEIKCEYKKNPLGLDIKKPRVSWVIEADRRGMIQQAYQIQVSLAKGNFGDPIWDTGRVESDQSIHIEYKGPELKSRTRYYYRVKIWDHFGGESDWSEIAWWETALLNSNEWEAKWITPNPDDLDPLLEQVFLLRKELDVKVNIESARIYATSAGLYELSLNGERVGDELLTPGWTSYNTRLQYQTYDVTNQLVEGSNVLGIALADGWYKGNLTWLEKRHIYGDRRAALLQLHVRYEDGTEERVGTDTTWKSSTGPILMSELYDGERYDARLEKTGWNGSGYDDTYWNGVIVHNLPVNHLVAQENWPARVTEKIHPVSAFVTPSGDTVLDMGQNMVGRMRITVTAPKGTKIVLKHAEVLDKDGNIYFGNLRKADQLVEYTTKGEGKETYAPYFTFQGFRYVKVEGYPNQENGLPLENFIGEVIHSDMELTGEFECSNEMVNKLQQNIVWGQRGNFVDVPTDCPQRDERLGWTGDAQIFIRTALFNYQGGPFFTKWLRDLKADQRSNGSVPFVIPNALKDYISTLWGDETYTSSAWGDAATVCPWTLYLSYGDKRLLSEQYESMKSWVDFIRVQGKDEFLWDTGFHFGDWLALDAEEDSYFGATPEHMVATAYYALSTRILRDTASVLEKQEDFEFYSKLLNGIIANFNEAYITETNQVIAQTQTANILPLMFDLVEGDVRKQIAYDLNDLVVKNDYHLTTGFVGTPYLCIALSENGYHSTAEKLLLQETYPSWLYSIKKGATTIWEHWDGIKEDGSFWSDDMNSFNHYAYGAIGDWMYRYVAGLDLVETESAYKQIRIHPRFGSGEITFARAMHHSMYGKIVSSWSINNNEMTIEVEVPANTTANITLPNARIGDIKESGKELGISEGLFELSQFDGGVEVTVGSGSYRFVYKES